jgi:hypothetical protein
VVSFSSLKRDGRRMLQTKRFTTRKPMATAMKDRIPACAVRKPLLGRSAGMEEVGL